MKTRIRPSDIFLINSLILGNQATSSGGGCYVTGSLLDLLNCTVSGNEIVEFIGGGLRAQNMGEITVSNSII